MTRQPLKQQAEANFTTLINTLTHQKEVYLKAEYKKRQGIDEDDDEKERLEAKKREEETKKKQAAVAEARKKEVAEKEAARKAKEAAEKAAAANGVVETTKPKEAAKAKEDGDESDDDDESKGAKPVHNGGITDKYTWTQTLQELQVVFSAEQLGLAPGLPLRSRDLTVDVKKKHLKISLKGKEALVDGELHKEVCLLRLVRCRACALSCLCLRCFLDAPAG